MAAIATPEIDRRTFEDLRDRVRSLEIDLSGLDLPSLETAGRRADRAIDRWTGRSRSSGWQRVLLGLAVIGAAIATVAWVTSSRRYSWDDEVDLDEVGTDTGTDLDATTFTEPQDLTGLTAAESSLLSRDPNEDSLP